MIEYRENIPCAATLYYPGYGPVQVNLEEVLPEAYPISKTEYDNLLIRLSLRGDDDDDDDE